MIESEVNKKTAGSLQKYFHTQTERVSVSRWVRLHFMFSASQQKTFPSVASHACFLFLCVLARLSTPQHPLEPDTHTDTLSNTHTLTK